MIMDEQQEWIKEFNRRQALYEGKTGLGYWESRARDFSEMRSSRNWEFGRRILKTLYRELPEKAKVLDIGAGPGSLLVPFSEKLGEFTAVEPSTAMLSELKKNASKARISNFSVLTQNWENIKTSALEGSFDLVIISITLWMFRDLPEQIKRMEKCSRGLCSVVACIDDNRGNSEDSLWEKILGDVPRPSYSEFPFIFNLLYKMRRSPEVRFIEYQAERSLNAKIQQQKLFYAKYVRLTPQTEQIIENEVRKHSHNGIVTENYISAVVWWKLKK